jgi:EAL domain-containing protein (putative c-di-GMP-specific phosphodiesterase class I)
MMQGYRFCRPMDAAALEMWIASRENSPPSNVVPMIAA